MDARQNSLRSINVDKHQELRNRTKAFALRVIHMSDALPRTRSGNVIGNQILRSATGMAANYRAAGRSRSKAEFIAKIGVVIEEADETVFGWKCSEIAASSNPRSWIVCWMKQINYLQSLPHPEGLQNHEEKS